MMRIAFVSLLILFFTESYCQGPIDGYMKGKSTLDIAISYSHANASKYYGVNNEIFKSGYKSNSIGLFAEYGFNKWLDAVITLPFIFTEQESKFQDLGMFLKFRPLYIPVHSKAKVGIIASAGYSTPISKYGPDMTGALGQRAKVIPLRLIAQAEFVKGIFINLTIGYQIRVDKVSAATITKIKVSNPGFVDSKPANHATFMVKGGMAAKSFYFDVFAEYQKTFGGLNFEDGVAKPSQLYAVNFLKIGGSIYYPAYKFFGLSANLSYIPAGENIGDLISISASLIFKINFKKSEYKKIKSK